MNCGTILYDKEFLFGRSGTVIDKLIVVLCELGSNYLIASTTSKQHYKNRKAGCQINDKPPNFFLPKGSCWFNEDTWIELNAVDEIDFDILQQKKADKIVLYKSVLPNELMKDLMKCALQSEDIEELYLEYIQRAYDKL